MAMPMNSESGMLMAATMRGAHAAQEGEDDEDGEEAAEQALLQQAVDRLGDEVGLVGDGLDGDDLGR